MRDRRNIKLDTSTVSTVDTGAKRERQTYDARLRNMTKGTVERYRVLREAGLISEGTFSQFVDNLIVDKLIELEAKHAARKANK